MHIHFSRYLVQVQYRYANNTNANNGIPTRNVTLGKG